MGIETRLAVRKTRNRRESAGRKQFVGIRRLPGGREIKLVVTKRRSEAVNRTIARSTQGGGDEIATTGSSQGGYASSGAGGGDARGSGNGINGRQAIF